MHLCSCLSAPIASPILTRVDCVYIGPGLFPDTQSESCMSHQHACSACAQPLLSLRRVLEGVDWCVFCVCSALVRARRLVCEYVRAEENHNSVKRLRRRRSSTRPRRARRSSDSSRAHHRRCASMTTQMTNLI
eukprot:3272814-Pleurochrysis_carterae.AAC.1